MADSKSYPDEYARAIRLKEEAVRLQERLTVVMNELRDECLNNELTIQYRPVDAFVESRPTPDGIEKLVGYGLGDVTLRKVTTEEF